MTSIQFRDNVICSFKIVTEEAGTIFLLFTRKKKHYTYIIVKKKTKWLTAGKLAKY